jgi:membrane fusion protein (multidrug efflux system)
MYNVLTLKSTTRTVSSNYPASIQGRQDIAIYPQVSGTISQVCVKEGERVRKEQNLFVIDQVPFRAALQMAEANVEAAKAGVATAQLLYDSRQALFDQQVISEFDLKSSYNQLLTAKAQLAQAQAQQVTAANNFSYTMVQSPSNGVVGTIPFRAGALVSPSLPIPLTTVSDNSQMYVYFSLTESQLYDLTEEYGSMGEALNAMPEVSLRLSNGSVYPEKGIIETISGVIDQSTGSVSARAVFDNKGEILHSGASGRVILPREITECLAIPASATFEMQDKVFVYRVVDGKASSTTVEVSLTDDGQEYIVTSGLNAGDVIVAEGVGMLRDGSPVEAKSLLKVANTQNQE